MTATRTLPRHTATASASTCQAPDAGERVAQIKKEVFIACPVCYSGNCFQLERSEEGCACADCGFVLAKNPGADITESEKCIFCGGRYFYFESPLDLFFLGRASICYVCEARYTGVRIDHPEGQYNQESARGAQRSGSSLRWDERVKRHGPQAGI